MMGNTKSRPGKHNYFKSLPFQCFCSTLSVSNKETKTVTIFILPVDLFNSKHYIFCIGRVTTRSNDEVIAVPNDETRPPSPRSPRHCDHNHSVPPTPNPSPPKTDTDQIVLLGVLDGHESVPVPDPDPDPHCPPPSSSKKKRRNWFKKPRKGTSKSSPNSEASRCLVS